jgi:UDP-N-acetylmuramoyl-tripeptide--D-alanyl-D-alanine ligase
MFGVTAEQIKRAIERYQPGNNRSQITQTDRNLLILDAYNANPTSMKAAIGTFGASSYQRKCVILGDMLELGDATDQEHLELLKLLEQFNFDEVYLVGPVFTRLNTRRENICFNDSELALLWFSHHTVKESTILLKGSRGIRLEKITAAL